MKKNCCISIITPTFNREKSIENTIKSVLNQTFTDWEMLIIDDLSTDKTSDIVKSFTKIDSRIKLFIRDRLPKGAPTCRNIGIKNASGKYIIFLDSDDILLPHCLDQRYNFIKQNPKLKVAIFPIACKSGNDISIIPIFPINYPIKNFLKYDNTWTIMNPIWNKEFLLLLKGFDESYERMQDIELMIRALIQLKHEELSIINNPYDAIYFPSAKTNSVPWEKQYTANINFINKIPCLLPPIYKTEIKLLNNYLKLFYRDCYFRKGFTNCHDMKYALNLNHKYYRNNVISIFKVIKLDLLIILHGITHYINGKTIYSIIK